MSITISLPPQVESEFIAAAHARGITAGELMAETLLAHQPQLGRVLQEAPSGEARLRATADLKAQMDAIAEHAKDIPDQELDELLEEALAACRRE